MAAKKKAPKAKAARKAVDHTEQGTASARLTIMGTVEESRKHFLNVAEMLLNGPAEPKNGYRDTHQKNVRATRIHHADRIDCRDAYSDRSGIS